MKANFLFSSTLVLNFILFFLSPQISAQNQLTIPQPSQKASVMQRIGLTDIRIDYHRPGVKGREVWGNLVPYNQVWRAGANENTTISFSDPVMINGKSLPAGTYGLHMIPAEGDWTIIFSKNNWSWGSFFYDQKDDALRITTKPQTAEFQEWLVYTMDNPVPNSVDVNLSWEKIKVGFTVSINLNEVVADHFKKELDNIPGFSWQAWNQAANYALNNNNDLDEALAWSDRSIGINKTGLNLWTKAEILNKEGNSAEADKLRTESLSIATEAELNTIGYQLLFANQVDRAIDIFKKNIEMHPESWNVYDSLGEAYMNKGENKMAIENYKKAATMVKDDTNKDRISKLLQKLESD